MVTLRAYQQAHLACVAVGGCCVLLRYTQPRRLHETAKPKVSVSRMGSFQFPRRHG